MANGTVQIKWSSQALKSINRRTQEGLVRLGFDIASQARRNAPYLSGALRSTIRVQEISDNELDVRAGGAFGNKVVNYAWIREKGPNKNPATEHYMENAQKAVMSGDYMQKYFGRITK